MQAGHEDPPRFPAGSIGGERWVIDHAHEAFVAMDAGGFVIDWNRWAERTFGWSREEALGRVLGELIIPLRYRAAHLAGLRRFLDTGEAPVLDRRLEFRAIDRSGREFPVELTISRQRGQSAPRFFAFLHDISERKFSERLLRAQHAISSVFAEAQSKPEAITELLAGLGQAMGWRLGAWWSRDGDEQVLRCRAVWRCDPATAADFEAVSLKLELARGSGLAGRAWETGQPVWSADLAADESFSRSQAAGRAGLHAALCVPVVSKHQFRGAIEFFSAEIGDPDEPTRAILATTAAQIGGFLTLLDERSALLAKLEQLALTDELTGLPNRRAWQESLERELARARRDRRPLCVAMLDVDHFKQYNDSHGHQAGDGLLREIAQSWRAQLRAGDILARYGGEEFALLFSGHPVESSEMILQRVRAATPGRQTCSAGLAAFNGSETAEQLISRSDAALYEAKAHGRDRTVIAATDRPGPGGDTQA
jgi:diguanylate cyclase (GGDEF)-like protein/PAS domain S-box-containing protein